MLDTVHQHTLQRRNAGTKGPKINPRSGLPEPGDHRLTIHVSRSALVEDTAVPASRPAPSGFERRHQVVLPYYGLFAYSVGNKTSLVDCNTTLLVTSGREYSDAHPVSGVGHAAVVISPSRDVLDEVCSSTGVGKFAAFSESTRPLTHNSRLLAHRLRGFLKTPGDALEKDEWTILALQEALSASKPRQPQRSKIVERAREALHALSSERANLNDIAAEVGVSPVYLTQEFTRTLGMPLYRYLMQLRLSKALLELPHCNDITGLALDLGFSSHSHFTSTFRRNFGLTPTEYRASGPDRAFKNRQYSEPLRRFG